MSQESRLNHLSRICRQIDDKEPAMDKNFYGVNLHGYETGEDYIVPKNVRIIMFCYSGRKLNVCPSFDKFNWKNIFSNESASYNYCTFLANIAQYPSIRDHFCIYEPGDIIKEIKFLPDEYFNHGVFELPVRAAVYSEEDDKIYTTDIDTSGKVMTSRKMSRYSNKISFNRDKASYALRYRKNPSVIFSRNIMSQTTLSTLAKNVTFRHGGATILLLTCREGKHYKLSHKTKVKEQLEELYMKYLERRRRSKPPVDHNSRSSHI